MTKAVLPTYNRATLRFVSGQGAWLTDESGERYLDFGAGIAVNALGHAHPCLVEALTEQAGRLWHTSNLYEVPIQEALARRLAEATFADMVFFCNSGAEAMEASIKMARKFHSHRGQPERWRIITFEGSFHGRTLATIAAAGAPKLVDGFGPMPGGFDPVAFDNPGAVEAAISTETAGVLLEPIQGEGGIRPFSHETLRAIRALCDQHGILLILDEIQCGMGRTGRLFAHELAGMTPDIMGVAKGIGGGFPLGACLATKEAAAGMTAGTHGSTFGGNPLAMAVGNAVLDQLLAEGFLDHVCRQGGALRQGLSALADSHHGIVEGVRGEGLMLGIRCRVPAAPLVARCQVEKLLVVPAAEETLRILPPLNVTDEEIRVACGALDRAFSAHARQDAGS